MGTLALPVYGTLDYGEAYTDNGHVYDECPLCGERKTADAEYCRTCTNAARSHVATQDEGTQERHRRYSLALEAGWQIAELQQLARRNALPTLNEILARRPDVVIGAWWRRAA